MANVYPESTGAGPTSSLVGLAVLRGAGAVGVQRRLPRRSPVGVGRRNRHGFELTSEWVPRDLTTLTPVEAGWLATNNSRTPMRVESDWVQGGVASYLPHAVVMLQRGDHRLTWPALEAPIGLSVTVRTRGLEDRRIPYAVDSAAEAASPPSGVPLGVRDAPLAGASRYRLAVLFSHLIEGGAEPRELVTKRAQFLGISEETLEEVAQRYRRRVNAARGTDLQSVRELGDHLVAAGELTRQDLDP